MATTTEASFSDRVQKVLGDFGTTGVMDRYAANDVLLDLLDAAVTDDEQARVLGALAQLPKSSLVDRSLLAGLLAGLSASSN
ncbi:MAG: hypothetical protein M3357_09160 [Actinomycetota bacterium]|nr:hypothetical protein [Actinomycetota bacterium]